MTMNRNTPSAIEPLTMEPDAYFFLKANFEGKDQAALRSAAEAYEGYCIKNGLVLMKPSKASTVDWHSGRATVELMWDVERTPF